jgi:hypothetical protein
MTALPMFARWPFYPASEQAVRELDAYLAANLTDHQREGIVTHLRAWFDTIPHRAEMIDILEPHVPHGTAYLLADRLQAAGIVTRAEHDEAVGREIEWANQRHDALNEANAQLVKLRAALDLADHKRAAAVLDLARQLRGMLKTGTRPWEYAARIVQVLTSAQGPEHTAWDLLGGTPEPRPRPAPGGAS